MAQGDIPEARSRIQKSLDLFAGFITGWDVVQSHIYLGDAAAAVGDADQARSINLNALDLAKEAK
jgi:hypothetical protein